MDNKKILSLNNPFFLLFYPSFRCWCNNQRIWCLFFHAKWMPWCCSKSGWKILKSQY